MLKEHPRRLRVVGVGPPPLASSWGRRPLPQRGRRDDSSPPGETDGLAHVRLPPGKAGPGPAGAGRGAPAVPAHPPWWPQGRALVAVSGGPASKPVSPAAGPRRPWELTPFPGWGVSRTGHPRAVTGTRMWQFGPSPQSRAAPGTVASQSAPRALLAAPHPRPGPEPSPRPAGCLSAGLSPGPSRLCPGSSALRSARVRRRPSPAPRLLALGLDRILATPGHPRHSLVTLTRRRRPGRASGPTH